MTPKGTTERCPTCGSDKKWWASLSAPSAPRKCPNCGGPILGTAHGEYCPKETCKWGWDVEMDGSPLKPPVPSEPVRELVEALRLTVPFLFEHGAHVNPHCYRGSDDGCYCGLAEAKAEVERVLARYQK